MSIILMEIWKEESACLNTKEMLANFKLLNNSHITEDIIIGSTDANALYQSLDITFYTSSVQVLGLKADELEFCLALNRTLTELRNVGLSWFCPWNRNEFKAGHQSSQVVPRKRIILDACTVATTCWRAWWGCHLKDVHWGNEICPSVHQGEPQVHCWRPEKADLIGLECTAVLVQLFMVWWDSQFMKKVDKNCVRSQMFKRYVDNLNVTYNNVASVSDQRKWRSPFPWSFKRTILPQEVSRILLDCSRELPWKTVVGHRTTQSYAMNRSA